MAVAILDESQLKEFGQSCAQQAARLAVDAVYRSVPEIMNLAQIAQYLGVSEGTVRNRMRDNFLPHSHQLGDTRFQKTLIDNWLSSPHLFTKKCEICLQTKSR